jgi:hypothetical protein
MARQQDDTHDREHAADCKPGESERREAIRFTQDGDGDCDCDERVDHC